MRHQTITPYTPDRVELLDSGDGAWSSTDIGKPVKLAGDLVSLCDDGDEIYGFVRSVELGTKGGNHPAGVGCDFGVEFYGYDEDNDLAVGDLVISGTPTAIGTAVGASGPNLDKAAALTPPSINKWMVMAISNRKVLVRRV